MASQENSKEIPIVIPTLERLHKLWRETSDFEIEDNELEGKELQIYFTATVGNILIKMIELETLSKSDPNQEFTQAFLAMRPKLMRQLRLLTEVGLVLWPCKMLFLAEHDTIPDTASR